MHMAAAQNCLAEPRAGGCSFPASRCVLSQSWGQRGDGEITGAAHSRETGGDSQSS